MAHSVYLLYLLNVTDSCHPSLTLTIVGKINFTCQQLNVNTQLSVFLFQLFDVFSLHKWMIISRYINCTPLKSTNNMLPQWVETNRLKSGFRKTRVFQKAQPTGFFGFYWVLGFIGFFWIFLSERADGKLVGWSLEAVNIKKSSLVTGMTNWNWIKFGAGFLLVFSTGFTHYPGVWTMVEVTILGLSTADDDHLLPTLTEHWQARRPSCCQNNSTKAPRTHDSHSTYHSSWLCLWSGIISEQNNTKITKKH